MVKETTRRLWEDKWPGVKSPTAEPPNPITAEPPNPILFQNNIILVKILKIGVR